MITAHLATEVPDMKLVYLKGVYDGAKFTSL